MLLLPFVVSLFVSGVVCAYERNTSSDLSYTGYESIWRRNDEIAQRFTEDAIQGVRKMSGDEGEKFLLEYWSFAGEMGSPVSAGIGESISLVDPKLPLINRPVGSGSLLFHVH